MLREGSAGVFRNSLSGQPLEINELDSGPLVLLATFGRAPHSVFPTCSHSTGEQS